MQPAARNGLVCRNLTVHATPQAASRSLGTVPVRMRGVLARVRAVAPLPARWSGAAGLLAPVRAVDVDARLRACARPWWASGLAGSVAPQGRGNTCFSRCVCVCGSGDPTRVCDSSAFYRHARRRAPRLQPTGSARATMEMNPKLAAQQTNLMLGGEKWEPSSTSKTAYTWHDNGKAAAESKAQGTHALPTARTGRNDRPVDTSLMLGTPRPPNPTCS